MAFQAAAGYTSLQNGNFSPTIFSKKAQKSFRKVSVIEAVTNNEYMGEISNYGDSVRIIKEPEIVVTPYARGQQVTAQDLIDEDFTLTIDQANAFAFIVDDIEQKHSHVNFETLASDRAAYKLKDHYDRNVLGYMSGYVFDATAGTWSANSTVSGTVANSSAGTDELLAANKLEADDFGGTGGNSIPLVSNGGTGALTSPLQVLNRMSRKLDQANVPTDDRWVVVDPVFVELLQDEDSKLVNNDYASGQDAGGLLRNGLVTVGKIRGFTVFKSNNLPYLGTGPDTSNSSGSSSNYGVIVAGHRSAVATAMQLTKTESFRSQQTFGDVVRGMHLFGRKILRPESLINAKYNVA